MVSDQEVEALLPCPFCGGSNINTEGPCYTQFMCNVCGISQYEQDNHEAAVAAWNRRQAAIPPSGEAVAWRWSDDLAAAPWASTVLAAYFDQEAGEWIVQVFVAERPAAPFTHWIAIHRPDEAAPPARVAIDEAMVERFMEGWNDSHPEMSHDMRSSVRAGLLAALNPNPMEVRDGVRVQT